MEQIDKLIHEFLRTRMGKDLTISDQSLPPITLTYLIERLVITHVKLFMMEDQVRDPKLTDAEVGAIKRKIDYWNGVQRPRLVEGIGDIFAKAVRMANETMVREPNLKDYNAR